MKKSVWMLGIALFLAGCGTSTGTEQQEEPEQIVEEEQGVDEENTETAPDENDNLDEDKEASIDKDNKGNEATAPTAKVDNKDQWIKKLDGIKTSLTEFDEVLKNGTQIEMNEAYEEIFKRWDTGLNDVYGVLETQLSPKEMEQLREKQRSWIQYRDETAKEESLKYEGGSMQTLEYFAAKARLTEERCYELVNTYME